MCKKFIYICILFVAHPKQWYVQCAQQWTLSVEHLNNKNVCENDMEDGGLNLTYAHCTPTQHERQCVTNTQT